MSLPQNAVSPTATYSEFMPPKNVPYAPLVSLHYGGVALNDSSQGRLVDIWTFSLSGNDVQVARTIGAPTVLFTRAGITHLSGAFDSNMQPVVVFKDGTGCFIWYFDSLAGSFIFKAVAGASSIQCATDDLREFNSSQSDVVAVYLRAGAVYWRQQRNRYDTEYTAGTATGTVTRVGMNQGVRFQIEVDPRTNL